MNRPFSATTEKDFGDSYIDISGTERRLIKVTTKTCSNTGTYLSLKLFKKAGDDEKYLDQLDQLTKNKENIGMQPGPDEDVMPTIKREKPSNTQFSKMPRLCSSGSNSIKYFI